MWTAPPDWFELPTNHTMETAKWRPKNRFETRLVGRSSRRWSRAVSSWRQPWIGTKNAGQPANVVSNNPYRESTPCCCPLHQQRHGFRSNGTARLSNGKTRRSRIMRRPDDVPPGQWGCGIIYDSPITRP